MKKNLNVSKLVEMQDALQMPCLCLKSRVYFVCVVCYYSTIQSVATCQVYVSSAATDRATNECNEGQKLMLMQLKLSHLKKEFACLFVCLFVRLLVRSFLLKTTKGKKKCVVYCVVCCVFALIFC